MAGCRAVPLAFAIFLSGLAGHAVVFRLSLASVKPNSPSSSQSTPQLEEMCFLQDFLPRAKAETTCGQKSLFF